MNLPKGNSCIVYRYEAAPIAFDYQVLILSLCYRDSAYQSWNLSSVVNQTQEPEQLGVPTVEQIVLNKNGRRQGIFLVLTLDAVAESDSSVRTESERTRVEMHGQGFDFDSTFQLDHFHGSTWSVSNLSVVWTFEAVEVRLETPVNWSMFQAILVRLDPRRAVPKKIMEWKSRSKATRRKALSA
ncbi:hypothetical protein Trco_005786 [Trichoderma cornu-damae]|uniref:Uncharacterized protein n=1 Tax=Trichoderma cornu-damae TaxID=654480 RepID=A0A9P8QP45_9HYPO|nr:hypothetical protein Trco_005786 [Trichoderma cornu-damae]